LANTNGGENMAKSKTLIERAVKEYQVEYKRLWEAKYRQSVLFHPIVSFDTIKVDYIPFRGWEVGDMFFDSPAEQLVSWLEERAQSCKAEADEFIEIQLKTEGLVDHDADDIPF
jgi:hypothetical protein